MSDELKVGSIINRFRAGDYCLLSWSQVGNVKAIPREENVVNRLHAVLHGEIEEALRKRDFERRASIRLKLDDAADELTQAMLFHGLPTHFSPTMKKWHYLRIGTERLSTPHSLAKIFQADFSDENASSLNYIPFRLLPSRKLLVLDCPSWTMEVPE